LFDGIGGFPYAGSFFGIEPLWASEILPQAISVTRRRFPKMAHVGDITALDGGTLPPVDIITFGSPCQDLSTAGRRAGLAGERSGLFMEAIRIIDEMREATNGQKPAFAAWENVPGALSSGFPSGADFAAVLSAFTKTEIPIPRSGRWANAGLVRGRGVTVAWRVLNASLWGVPQRRRRVFLVASFGAPCAGEVLFVENGLSGHPAPGGQAGQGLAVDAPGGAGGAVPGRCLTPWDRTQSRVFPVGSMAPTLAGADGGGGRNPGGLVFVEPEFARTLTARGDGSPGVDLGPNVIAVGVHQNQAGDVTVSEAAYALATTGNATSRNAPLVAHPEISGTLCASGAGLSRPAGMASEPDLCVAYALPPIPIHNKATRYQGGGPTRKDDGAGNGLGIGKPGDPTPAMTAGGQHAVASAARSGYIVRRLTPTECERLQGFPDGWTAADADGKPISDSKRYMMLGNSVAIPCVAFVLGGIAAQMMKTREEAA